MKFKFLRLVMAMFTMMTTWSVNASDTFTNPVLPVDAADPTVLLAEDGYYYMCCSESYSGEGMPLWRSSDMVNWTKITTIFATRPANVTYDFLWAPELAYVNGKYVLFYANAKYGENKSTQICVATSDTPYGPYTDNKILLRAHDNNFGALNVNVDNVIDPSLFRDTDGKNYLVWGSFNGIFYVELDESCTSLKSGTSKKQVAKTGTLSGDWKGLEAPLIVKRDNYYYLITSKGTTVNASSASGITYQLSIIRGTSLGGTFKNMSGSDAFSWGQNTSDLLKGNDYVLGPGHCSGIVTDKNGTDWLFYHGYSKKSDGNWDYPGSRKLFISKVTWNGWPSVAAPSAAPIEMPAIDKEKQIASSRQIRTAADLQRLATDVNNGNPFINAVLMNDIDCSSIASWTPIGKDENHKFQGIIDGQGHRIKNLIVNKNNPVYSNQALVGVVTGGAQFRDLIVDGSCAFYGVDQVAGFVGHAKGSGSVQFLNCGNEACITASGANASGFLGYTSGVSIYWDNCYNTGVIKGDRESAAFSGWEGDRLRNCWNTGRTFGCDGNGQGKWLSLTRGNITKGYERAYDLNGANNSVTSSIDGYDKAWLADGHLAVYLNNESGQNIWRQTLGQDGHPVPVATSMNVYEGTYCDGSGHVYTNSDTKKEHNFNTFSTEGNELSCKCSICQTSKGVSAPIVDDFIQISTADQLELCMDYVTSGGGNTAKMKLMNDIDFREKGNKMFGRDEAGHKFNGVFDGQYNKVTVAYNDGGQRTALFRIIEGDDAVVKNLTVDGTITMNQYSMSGGICGTATDRSHIENCISAVTYIDGNDHDATFGGIAANTWTGVVINNCAFVGKVVAPYADGNGGFVGYDNSGSQVNITNSYVSADIIWKAGDDYVRNHNRSTFINCHKLVPTDATLASGKFCYDVIGGDWTQNLGEDAYPVLNHKKIFINGTYANVDETVELDEAKSFSTKEPFTTNVNLKRSLKANMWNTFCVPFDMENSQLGADAEVKELTGLSVEGEKFTMTFSEASRIEAGKPYMVRVPNAVTMLNLGEKTVQNDITPVQETAEGGTLTYTGVFNSGKADQGTFIISDNKFYLVNSDVNLKAYRGYITAQTTGGQQASVLTFTFDDEETSISEMENGTLKVEGSIHNLAGQRLPQMQRGINIVNGKKVLK